MKCVNCGNELRFGTEQVGVESNGVPVYHRFAYCDTCKIKQDMDIKQQNQNRQPVNNVKKKDSVMSIVACVMSGVACLLPLPALISFPLILAGLIVGLIDLCKNNKSERHIGSWFAMIFGVLALILVFR